MSWNKYSLSISNWTAGHISVNEVLYELERPTIFTAKIGLSKFLFLKKDELEETDIFLVCPITAEEIKLLTDGKLSVRGALSYKGGWIIEADLDLNVSRFQDFSSSDLERILPPKGLGLNASFGVVPDTTQEAQSFISFKFVGQSLSATSMKLSVFKELIDGISNLLRYTLLPTSLMKGRDYRFFDVEIGEPQFASLLVSIKSTNFDLQGLRNNKRTKNLVPLELAKDALDKSAVFWTSLNSTSSLAMKDELKREEADEYHGLLGQVVPILPSDGNDLESLSVTFHGSTSFGTLLIDKKTGDRLIRAQQFSKSSVRTLSGTVIEVNGEANTFIIKTGDRLTTCAPTLEIFAWMDDNDLLKRGQKLNVHGNLWKRIRRDYMVLDINPEAST